MDAATVTLVRDRAKQQCEYCLTSASALSPIAFHTEHIVAKQHGGSDDPVNLAYACGRCNLQKGPNLAAVDPLTGNIVLLFHPRKDRWKAHFKLSDGMVVGLTETGRATVRLLKMNSLERIEIRREFKPLLDD